LAESRLHELLPFERGLVFAVLSQITELDRFSDFVGKGDVQLVLQLFPFRGEFSLESLDPFASSSFFERPPSPPLLDAPEAPAPSEDHSMALSETSFMELGVQVGKVHSFCEICILVMQMKMRGQPHLCAGLSTNYYITCVEVLESLLRTAKAVVYWLNQGCMHIDSTGPEIVRPCPAINICSWMPNLFAEAPSLVRNGIETLCPRNPKFLPQIPKEFKNLLVGPSMGKPGTG